MEEIFQAWIPKIRISTTTRAAAGRYDDADAWRNDADSWGGNEQDGDVMKRYGERLEKESSK